MASDALAYAYAMGRDRNLSAEDIQHRRTLDRKEIIIETADQLFGESGAKWDMRRRRASDGDYEEYYTQATRAIVSLAVREVNLQERWRKNHPPNRGRDLRSDAGNQVSVELASNSELEHLEYSSPNLSSSRGTIGRRYTLSPPTRNRPMTRGSAYNTVVSGSPSATINIDAAIMQHDAASYLAGTSYPRSRVPLKEEPEASSAFVPVKRPRVEATVSVPATTHSVNRTRIFLWSANGDKELYAIRLSALMSSENRKTDTNDIYNITISLLQTAVHDITSLDRNAPAPLTGHEFEWWDSEVGTNRAIRGDQSLQSALDEMGGGGGGKTIIRCRLREDEVFDWGNIERELKVKIPEIIELD